MSERPINRRTAVVVITIAVLVALPAAVWAAHNQFTDVPNDHTFHNDIDWMVDNGITHGCNPPANDNYCPDDFVTRGQMAAFMRRLADAGVVDAGTVGGFDPDDLTGVGWDYSRDPSSFGPTNGFEDLGASTSIFVPDGHVATVIARFTAESVCSGASYASVRIMLDGQEMLPDVGNDFSFDSSDGGTEGGDSWESHSVERMEFNVSPGPHLVDVEYSSGCAQFRVDDWTLVVESDLGLTP